MREKSTDAVRRQSQQEREKKFHANFFHSQFNFMAYEALRPSIEGAFFRIEKFCLRMCSFHLSLTITSSYSSLHPTPAISSAISFIHNRNNTFASISFQRESYNAISIFLRISLLSLRSYIRFKFNAMSETENGIKEFQIA